MRINQFVARATGLSRRQADDAIAAGRVQRNGAVAQLGEQVAEADQVQLDGQPLQLQALRYILFNKPTGYVCSRRDQGERPTIYKLLPEDFKELRPVGRLDADSSGLLLLTNDGPLAFELTHPGQGKEKIYQVELDRPLDPAAYDQLTQGVDLGDGISTLEMKGTGKDFVVTMREGRNRQIRRTFGALGYTVVKLHRTHFGPWSDADLSVGSWTPVDKPANA